MRRKHINLALVVVLAAVAVAGGCRESDRDVDSVQPVTQLGMQPVRAQVSATSQSTTLVSTSISGQLSSASETAAEDNPTLSTGRDVPGMSAINPEKGFVDLSVENVPGVPAIKPQYGFVDRSTPTYSVGNVGTYIAGNPFKYAVEDNAQTVVETIEFVHASVAMERVQTKIYRDGDELVCLVLLKGHFVKDGPGALGYSGSTAFMVFDAYTGYLLVLGIMP